MTVDPYEIQISGFRTTGKLAAGTWGALYGAIGIRSRERAVIKVGGSAPPTTVPPRALPVIEQGHTPTGVPYTVMSLGPAEDLMTLVRCRGGLDSALLNEVLSQVAASLDALHSQGVIHADLRPENVLVFQSELGPRAVLVDWGVAHRALTHPASATVPAAIPPAEGFAAPEVRRGDAATASSDIWSFAATTRWAVENTALRRPSGPGWQSEEGRQILRTALAAEPASRPRSARDLLDTLHQSAISAAQPAIAAARLRSRLERPVPSSAPGASWVAEHLRDVRWGGKALQHAMSSRRLAAYCIVASAATLLMLASNLGAWGEATRYSVGATMLLVIVPTLLAWQEGLLDLLWVRSRYAAPRRHTFAFEHLRRAVLISGLIAGIAALLKLLLS